MVFCAYCGKSFTRKEHLERHIPSHTNVKPHRCSGCQLSFARRDLLQRHHSTYHEARDPMEPLTGGVPTIAGRMPIACQNCANAKTGCDKRVPCSRCAEKNLPCAARFARRSSKAAVRAAQVSAAAAMTAQLMATSPSQQQQQQHIPVIPPLSPLAPGFVSLDGSSGHHLNAATVATTVNLGSPLGINQMTFDGTTGLGMRMQDMSALQQSHMHQQMLQQQQRQHAVHSLVQHHQHYPQHQAKQSTLRGNLSPSDFSSPPGVDALDEFMGFGTSAGDFLDPEATYHNFVWNDYPIDLDTYANPLYLGSRPDSDMNTASSSSTATNGGLASSATAAVAVSLVPPFTATTELSDASSSSEPMTVSSSQGSDHTRGTSIMSSSTGEYEGMMAARHTHSIDSSTGRGSSGSSAHDQAALSLTARDAAVGHALPMATPRPYEIGCEEIQAAIQAIPEFEVVVASEAAWPLARCNPPIFSGACPRTAIVHLECLEQKSRQDGTWAALEEYLSSDNCQASEGAVRLSISQTVVPLSPRSRDKMLAITQRFLHKALDIHRSGVYAKNSSGGLGSPGMPGSSSSNSGHQGSHNGGSDFNFLVLPPSRILEYFLRSYVQSLSIYYPLVVGGVVDPNEMLDHNQASTLLVLLMIAQGAAAIPMAEARYLSAGLTETCRISLFDIIEKNVELSADPTALRCALLFTLLGAWGGDKWQMDIAMGQRSMYLSMLKHAGMLEPQPPMISNFSSAIGADLQWREWVKREAQNRLVYNWVMVDQELSLFHDTAPVLSISDLQCPIPSPEALWLASNSDNWVAAVQRVYDCSGSAREDTTLFQWHHQLTPSLCGLFQEFLRDNLARRKTTLTPQQLRLLLHPLQSMLCHLRQMLSCLPDDSPRSTAANASLGPRGSSAIDAVFRSSVTKASTQQRLEEVQAQLQHWYELSLTYYKAHPQCVVTCCNLVLYHLISLNAVSNFSEVERLARRDGINDNGISVTGDQDLRRRHSLCFFQRVEAIFHCGQVLRLLRQMPADRRPSWWTSALYRAVLILWADSICHHHMLQMSRSEPQDSIALTRSAVSSSHVTSLSSPPKSSTSPASVRLDSGRSISPTTNSSPSRGSASTAVAKTTALSPDPSISSHESLFSHNSASNSTFLVAIDQLTPEDPAIIAYLWGGEGVAALTRRDGSKYALEDQRPSELLQYAVRRIEEATCTRIGDGIRRKFLTLATNWSIESFA